MKVAITLVSVLAAGGLHSMESTELKTLLESDDVKAQIETASRLSRVDDNAKPSETDVKAAISLFEKACERDGANGYFGLGAIQYAYYENPGRAFGCFRKAADCGSVEALSILGDMALNGKGCAKNVAEARGWFKKAVEKGDVSAVAPLISCYDDNEEIGEDVTKSVFNCCYSAAKQNEIEGCYLLGVCFEMGLGVAVDYKSARTWFQKSVEAGHVAGMYRLGMLFLLGRGGTIDLEKAKALLESAKRNGHDEAGKILCELKNTGTIAQKWRWYMKFVL